MNTSLLVSALLVASASAQAGYIVGNAGFTVFEDPTAWAAAHPNATPASPFGVPSGLNSTNLVTDDWSFTGWHLSSAYWGSVPAVWADPTSGVAVQISPLANNIFSIALQFTPLPGGTYEQVIVYGNAGNDLDYYADTGGSFFFGVTSSDPIAKITLLTPYGGASSAQQIVLSGFQQDQAETPEPATARLLAGPAVFFAIRRGKR